MGWLERYLEYTSRQESPEIFHLWSAIAMLGHVMGRRCWWNRYEIGYIYPAQIMVVLVSASAVSRKTAGLSTTSHLLRYLPDHLINILPDLTSLEGMLTALERGDPRDGHNGEKLDSVGIILNDELGTFISKSTYAESIVKWLTRLNTCQEPSIDVRFRSWGVSLTNPCVGMLAATTPTGLAEDMPRAVFKGGLLGRLMLIFSEDSKEPDALARPKSKMKEALVWLIQDLDRISKLEGEYHFADEEAIVWFETWYRKHSLWCKSHLTADQRESGWQGRKHDHVLRAAMVLEGSAGNNFAVETPRLQQALHFVDDAHSRFPEALAEIGTREEFTTISTRMLEMLEKHGRQSWSDILRRMHRYGNKDKLRPELETLIQMNHVRRFLSSTGAEWFQLIGKERSLPTPDDPV